MAQTAALSKRVERLRNVLDSTPAGRKTLLKLVPSTRLQSNHNIMDFCDWQQFSQWPQSTY